MPYIRMTIDGMTQIRISNKYRQGSRSPYTGGGTRAVLTVRLTTITRISCYYSATWFERPLSRDTSCFETPFFRHSLMSQCGG